MSPETTPRILGIPPREAAALDAAALARLQRRFGRDRTRRLLSDAALDIIERLTRFELAAAEGAAEKAARLARTIAALSEEIGAVGLARAAQAAADGQSGRDTATRAATAARLVRTGEAALETLMGLTLAPAQ